MNGILTLVRAERFGSVVNVVTLAGATVLPLDDTIDFDEDGGLVLIDDLTYEYTEVAEESLTLATPLSVDVALDTSVWSLDAEGNVEVEWFADVDLGEDGDIVPALIPTALIDAFPEGDAAAGSVVEVELRGEDYRVTSRPAQMTGVYSGRYRNSDQTITDSTWTTVLYNAYSGDADRRINYAGGTWTVTVPGVYLLVARVNYEDNISGVRRIRVLFGDGTAIEGSPTADAPALLEMTAMESLGVGATLRIQTRQNSGGDLDILGGAPTTNMRIAMVGSP